MTRVLTEDQRTALVRSIGAQIEVQLGDANDTLVEYVMTMVKNGKNVAAIEKDLVDLIEEEPAAIFAEWLAHALESIDSSHDALVEVENVVSAADEEPEQQIEDAANPINGKRRRQGGLLLSALAQAERNPPPKTNIFGRVGKIRQQQKDRAAAIRPSDRIAVISKSEFADENASNEVPKAHHNGKKRKIVSSEDAIPELVFTVKHTPESAGKGWAANGWGKGGWAGKGGKGGKGLWSAKTAWTSGKGITSKLLGSILSLFNSRPLALFSKG
jgi:hypothetical protein